MATNEEDRGARAATYDLPAGPHKYLANAGYAVESPSDALERRVAVLEHQIKELHAKLGAREHEQHGRLPLQSGLNAPAASTREGT